MKQNGKNKKENLKKHKKEVQAMNKAVNIHIFLIKDEHMVKEGYQESKNLTKP